VSVEVEKFCRWSQSQNVIPVIVSLKDRFEGIREKELQKTLAALPGLSDKEKNALENLTAAIVNKILHDPVTALKQMSMNSEGDLLADAVKKLFKLEQLE